MEVKWDLEAGTDLLDEAEIGVGLVAADAVMDVGGGEAYAEGLAGGCVGGVEGAEERNGVGSAGDGDADPVAGTEEVAMEGEPTFSGR